jgi:hypothetical protein
MRDLSWPYFRLTGVVDKLAVSAEWKSGYLTADPELLDVADLLVDLGEELTVDGVEGTVKAGFGEPVSAVLTLIRSFDQITKVEVAPDAPDVVTRALSACVVVG